MSRGPRVRERSASPGCLPDFVPRCSMCDAPSPVTKTSGGFIGYAYGYLCPRCVAKVQAAGPWRERRAARFDSPGAEAYRRVMAFSTRMYLGAGSTPRAGASALLATALLLLGCGDSSGEPTSDGGTSQASEATAGTAQTTGGGTEGASTSTSSTGVTSEASTTSETSETGATSETSETSETSATSSGTGTSGTVEPTTGPDPTTGGLGGQCGLADGDYGACEALIGWAFTGQSCELLSGCDCGDDCELFFESELDCATTCADAGECNEDKLVGVYLAQELTLGGFCDEVDVCTPDAYSQLLPELFPDLFTCEGSGQFCADQEEICTVSWGGAVSEPLWGQLCAASLLPGISTIACVIYGP